MLGLFGRLRRASLTARPMKCLLWANRIVFLGDQIGGDVITRDKLEKVWETPYPTTKKQVVSFLKLGGYYRHHIPGFAEIPAPLPNLLNKGKSERVQWNDAQEYKLQGPVLKLPDLIKPFILRIDAS